MSNGFDRTLRTLFIWEGVTPYLDRSAIDRTLAMISSTASRSILAFDYLTSEVLESHAPSLRLIRASLRAGGEPLKFGLPATPPVHGQLRELLEPHGLGVVDHVIIGDETAGSRSLGGLVIAEVEG